VTQTATIPSDEPQVHTDRDRFVLALALIALAGLIWRVVYVVWMRDHALVGDGVHYHYAALYLSDGRGFINPITLALTGVEAQDAVHPPAWTLLLAGPSALGLRSFLTHQLLTTLVGAATIVMTGLAGRAAFGRRVGLVAAGLAAVYPNVWLYERELLSEPLAMLGTATAIWLAYEFRASPGPLRAAALGAVVGLLAMTRSEMIALAGLLALPVILSARDVDWRRRLGWLALAAASCVVLIAPWAAYNSTRFERTVPLSAGLGSAMVQGNCQGAYHGDRLGYAEFGCIAFVKNLDADPSVADRQYRKAALRYMRDHGSRAPVVMAARVGRVFNVYRPLQQVHFEAARRGTELWVIRLALFAYWALLPFAVAGAVLARRRRIPIYPMLAFPAAIFVSVLLTIGTVRYRAPAEIPLVLLAAYALDHLIRGWTRRRHEPEAASRPVEVSSAP
jgi:4-amino-4-deoxy-L-arabinose transferase-like glycosyltransferase